MLCEMIDACARIQERERKRQREGERQERDKVDKIVTSRMVGGAEPGTRGSKDADNDEEVTEI